MATFLTTDFAEFAADFNLLWETPGTAWAVSSGDLTVGAASGVFTGQSWDSVEADANRDNIDILTSFEANQLNSYVMHVRGSGSAGSPTCYAVRFSGTWIRCYKFVASEAGTNIGSTACTIATNTKYWCRLRANSNDGTLTIWSDGGSEGSPIATVDLTDLLGDISAAGTSGPLAYNTTSTTYKFLQFGWGTNGDVAPATAGGTTHATSGALSADSAVVAGTAAHVAIHASSGALSAQSATVAGESVNFTIHASSGALSADAATVAGISVHNLVHASSGALDAGSAVIDGEAANTAAGVTVHYSSGALVAQDAVVDGTSAHVVNHQSSGALISGDAVVSGESIHNLTHATSGDLVAGSAEVSGEYQGGIAVVAGGGIGHGGMARKRPRLIKIEEAESPEEVIREIEEQFATSVKKPGRKPKTLTSVAKPLESTQAAPFDWIDYYTEQAKRLKDQQEQEMTNMLAQASLRVKQLQEQENSRRIEQILQVQREEEDMMLLLMAA